MSTKKFLELKQWNANHSSVWREIVSRFGQADYDDETLREKHKATLKAEWDAQEFSRNRQKEYPSIQEQLDMQYWDAVNGTNKWQEAIAKVKTDNPKPE